MTSKDQSKIISESFLKQSDELNFSKTEQISQFCGITEQRDSSETAPIVMSWKTVRFADEATIYTYPVFTEFDEENPIKALHHIRYSKGVAWLKACQNVKNFINEDESLPKKLTLPKLDMLLEQQYTMEVKSASEKESQEDDLRDIEETIDHLQKENEILKMDVMYLGAKKQNINTKRIEKSKSQMLSHLDRTYDNHRHNDTLLTFADEDKNNDNSAIDISYIPFDKEIQVGQSLDDRELTDGIEQIIEEDDEQSSDNEQSFESSKPLKIESLTNEST